jgi:hypothetical protein
MDRRGGYVPRSEITGQPFSLRNLECQFQFQEQAITAHPMDGSKGRAAVVQV